MEREAPVGDDARSAGESRPGPALVEHRLDPAPLMPPNALGYVHVAAACGPDAASGRRRRALIGRVVAATAAVRRLQGVQRVDVFDAIRVSLGVGARRRRGFDLAVLVECATVDAASRAARDPSVQAIVALLSGAGRVHCTWLGNARRIAEVDKSRGGVFLFNYFRIAGWPERADRASTMIAVWEHLAAWFTTHTGLDNSTLLVPVEGATSELVAMNHGRWDGLLDVVPHVVLRPSRRRVVDRTFDANGIVAAPVLHRLVGSDGVPAPRPVAGPALVGLGVIHSLATVPAVVAAVPWIRERRWLGGIATALPPAPEAMPALAALFSCVVGLLLVVAGGLLAQLERARFRIPAWLGPTLAVTGLVGGVLLPPTGFWLVLLAGLWFSSRRHRKSR